MQVQAYLNFNGKCAEAIEFYTSALGAKVERIMLFKDAPDPSMISPGSENKVMHATFHIGETTVMASDGRCSGELAFQGFSLCLIVPDVATSEKMFVALASGGQVQMPLAKTFFSPSFGMVADRFGVGWMIFVGQ